MHKWLSLVLTILVLMSGASSSASVAWVDVKPYLDLDGGDLTMLTFHNLYTDSYHRSLWGVHQDRRNFCGTFDDCYRCQFYKNYDVPYQRAYWGAYPFCCPACGCQTCGSEGTESCSCPEPTPCGDHNLAWYLQWGSSAVSICNGRCLGAVGHATVPVSRGADGLNARPDPPSTASSTCQYRNTNHNLYWAGPIIAPEYIYIDNRPETPDWRYTDTVWYCSACGDTCSWASCHSLTWTTEVRYLGWETRWGHHGQWLRITYTETWDNGSKNIEHWWFLLGKGLAGIEQWAYWPEAGTAWCGSHPGGVTFLWLTTTATTIITDGSE